MACKPDQNFRIIDNQLAVDEAITGLKQEALIAVKCEDVSSSREGKLTVISVATREKVYVFDVLTIGQSIFNSGLREILESKSQEKLMFDCREDSDALWHQFKIKLSGVLDVQLLEVMYRREKSTSKKPASDLKPSQYIRRSHRTHEVECLHSYYRCMEMYVKDEKLFETIKDEEGKRQLRKLSSIMKTFAMWEKRPLQLLQGEILQHFVVNKCMGMFRMYDKMKDILSGREKDRWQIASERYADFYRTREKRLFNGYEASSCLELDAQNTILDVSLSEEFKSFDGYETDAYLPLDIIPEKGTLSFPRAAIACICCARKFPREEFSNTQLRNGEQKCRVCKEIKRRGDVESNRESNYERGWFRWRYRRESDDDLVDFPACGNDDCYQYGCENCNCGGYPRY